MNLDQFKGPSRPPGIQLASQSTSLPEKCSAGRKRRFRTGDNQQDGQSVSV
jgi:hypothetical protein